MWRRTSSLTPSQSPRSSGRGRSPLGNTSGCSRSRSMSGTQHRRHSDPGTRSGVGCRRSWRRTGHGRPHLSLLLRHSPGLWCGSWRMPCCPRYGRRCLSCQSWTSSASTWRPPAHRANTGRGRRGSRRGRSPPGFPPPVRSYPLCRNQSSQCSPR